ncbi:hypothetical protein BC936DRAFT_136541 [Jimgerdemannia flammicorona]|uniref:Uncharacterized protein n=1 Tax=Jimgerdemannia flammicorona TaxID=994334 RepID=A0A433CZD6_9FUNG|nr:hypothetical protein BC936DRAFT_136541 [Jimgerdemannia flammicorona]
MIQNSICSDSIHYLTYSLFKNPNLCILDLQDNNFTVCGCLVLAEALNSWLYLCCLNVSECLLYNKGGITIVDALILDKNYVLEDVNLSYNKIESDTIVCLTKAITANLLNLIIL